MKGYYIYQIKTIDIILIILIFDIYLLYLKETILIFRNNILEAFDNQIELKLSVQFFKKSGKIWILRL